MINAWTVLFSGSKQIMMAGPMDYGELMHLYRIRLLWHLVQCIGFNIINQFSGLFHLISIQTIYLISNPLDQQPPPAPLVPRTGVDATGSREWNRHLWQWQKISTALILRVRANAFFFLHKWFPPHEQFTLFFDCNCHICAFQVRRERAWPISGDDCN